jgi:gallate dioxygenase
MRGQSLADFQKTRNAPGAMYSVSGKEGRAGAWDGAVQAPTGDRKP